MMHAIHRFCSAKSLKKLTCILLLLCLLSSLSLPAFAADGEPGNATEESPRTTDQDTAADGSSEEESSEDDELPPETDNPGPGAENPDPGSEGNPGEETPPEVPSPSVYTVTYHMGGENTSVEKVVDGQKPVNVPSPVKNGYSFTGWTDSSGQKTSPGNVTITEDISFYAQFSRSINDLLNTANHNSYVGGYETGMFKPDGSISRAEVAQIFYSLLLDKNSAPRNFNDVSANAWYYTPVSVLGGMEIINGYDDGTFRPLHSITRAEFVSMAVKFDEVSATVSPFPDVPASHWAVESIATAAQKGWVSGFNDNSFKPEQNLSRGEAVTIINGMLGRKNSNAASYAATSTNFYDVYSDHWAYGQIIEASTTHTFSYNADNSEAWQWHEEAPVVTTGKWVVDGNSKYYVDPVTQKFVKGEITVDGVSYVFDDSSRKLYNGWRYVNEWKRYYKDGLMQDDISGLGLVSGPYYIKVYKPANFLIIYAKDGDNGYTIPVKAMVVSCGYGTPTGTYYTPNQYRWLRMEGFTWAQWCTQISGNYLFHSVPNWTYNNFDLEVDEYNLLGQTRSMGCIRLACKDAKWIYDNCGLGTEVFISAIEESGPLSKPSSLQLPSWHTWDPTDPTAYYRCQELGCH